MEDISDEVKLLCSGLELGLYSIIPNCKWVPKKVTLTLLLGYRIEL